MSTENPYEGKTTKNSNPESLGEATYQEVFANPSRSDDNKLVATHDLPNDVEEIKDPVKVVNKGIDADESLPGVERGIADAGDKKVLEKEAEDRRESVDAPLKGGVDKDIDDADDKAVLEEAEAKRDATAKGETELVSTEVAAPTAIPAAQVPDGNIDDVLAWVGDDSAKAKQALETEEAATKPRVSLVKQLKEIAK